MKLRAVAFVLACACGPQVAGTGDGDSGADDTGSSTTNVPTSDAPTSDAPTTDPPTTDTPTTDADTTGTPGSTAADDAVDTNFIVEYDVPGVHLECDVWEQDCPPGQKCVAWGFDGGGSWNATHCTFVSDEPRADGESCTAPQGPFGGEDDCGALSMCFWVDERTNVGECVAMCIGSLDRPSCADGVTTCTLPSDGLPAVCLPECDPLAQDCPEGSACYFVHDHFECDPDVSGEGGLPGAACDVAGACDPGSVCVLATAVPGCASQTCCAEFCDLTDPICADGLECTPWYEDGEAPPGHEDIGACLLPEGG